MSFGFRVSPFCFGTQMRPRLRHERELRLVLARLRDAGGMDLCEARVAEQRAPAMGAPDGGAIGGLRIGGEVEHVAVATGGQHHDVTHMRLDGAGLEVARDDAARLAVDDDQVEHLAARMHRHRSGGDLALEGLVRAEQQLLPRLAAGVERPLDLDPAEGAGLEQATVVASERHALCDALVDDVHAHLRQAVGVGLAGAEVAALHGVVEEAEDAIAVVPVVLGRVHPALGRDGMSAARGVVEREALHAVALLPESGGRGGPGEARADDQDSVLAPVGGIHQLHLEAAAVPFLFDRSRRDSGFGYGHHRSLLQRTHPAKTATGTEMKPKNTTSATPRDSACSAGVTRALFHPRVWSKLQTP